ncbi:MAG: hypothetical protein KGK07_13665 [Chloroflexota bacterium]|nr:hypothetical protein [Chloroflexota bacterium]
MGKGKKKKTRVRELPSNVIPMNRVESREVDEAKEKVAAAVGVLLREFVAVRTREEGPYARTAMYAICDLQAYLLTVCLETARIAVRDVTDPTEPGTTPATFAVETLRDFVLPHVARDFVRDATEEANGG